MLFVKYCFENRLSGMETKKVLYNPDGISFWMHQMEKLKKPYCDPKWNSTLESFIMVIIK